MNIHIFIAHVVGAPRFLELYDACTRFSEPRNSSETDLPTCSPFVAPSTYTIGTRIIFLHMLISLITVDGKWTSTLNAP